jgi:hypothetical protein
MKRAILIALGTGAAITSAAALSIGNATGGAAAIAAHSEYERARVASAAREAVRAKIDEGYLRQRALCEPLGGAKRDRCFVAAHAARGRALLEAQAPYRNP